MQNDSVHLDKPLARPESRLKPVGCTWMNLPKGWGSKPIKEIGFTAPTYIPTDALTPVYEVPEGYVIVPIEPTQEMTVTGTDALLGFYAGDIRNSSNRADELNVLQAAMDAQKCYRAMIAAAQSGINPVKPPAK